MMSPPGSRHRLISVLRGHAIQAERCGGPIDCCSLRAYPPKGRGRAPCFKPGPGRNTQSAQPRCIGAVLTGPG